MRRPRGVEACAGDRGGHADLSEDGLTYTFQIRNDFAFSPPASGVVTAQSMKYTFERTLNHDMASPAIVFLSNIVGATEYNNGDADEITGIVAQGDTLTIHLLERQGEFLTYVAMPFLCAVPTTLPPVEQFAPIPSAGPYYISEHAINQQITIIRNPNYQGSRPQRFDTFEYLFNLNEQTAFQQVLSGDLDAGPLPAAEVQWVADQYGPDSEAAARGLQQFFPNPTTCVGYLPLNTSRPLFAPGQENLRKAVNFAVDRVMYGNRAGPYAASPYDQYLPPGMPGYEDIQVYPDHADLEHARDLAGLASRRSFCGRSRCTTGQAGRSTQRNTTTSSRRSSRSASSRGRSASAGSNIYTAMGIRAHHSTLRERWLVCGLLGSHGLHRMTL